MFRAEDKVRAVLPGYFLSLFLQQGKWSSIGKGRKNIAKRGLESRIGEEARKPAKAAVMNSGLRTR